MEIIKLNLIPNGVNPTCHAKQYDEGRIIRFELFDGLTPYTLQSGDTVTLNLRKPDNTIIETSVTATQGNKYVDLVTTEQMCACVGYNLGTFKIANGSVDIGTLNFIMAIERDVLADGIPSQSVIEDLDALVAEAVAEDLGDNYYTKVEVDNALNLKTDKTRTEEIIENNVTNINEIDYSDMTITDGEYLKNGVEKSATGFGIVEYIPVSAGQTVKIHYCRYDETNSQIALYNSNQEYTGNASDVTILNTYIASGNAVIEVQFVVPANTKYIRFTVRTNIDGTIMSNGEPYYLSDDYILITFKAPLYIPYNDLSNIIIDKSGIAEPKKIITWIDDDTGSDAYVATVKSICDTLGIKCTFATITDRWNTQWSASVATLQQLQKEGFHITTHSGNHKRWYTNDGDLPIFTAQELETDLVESLEALNSNGFLDYDCLVYPGSSAIRQDVDVVSIVKKWCSCGVLPNGSNYNVNFKTYGQGKYKINRIFFDKSSKTTQYYKDLLDSFTGEAWVLFGSHSNNSTQFDETMITDVLQYALNNGWEIMTLNEAIKYRNKYYITQDLFSLS